MNEIKLFDSELKLMELIWENDGATAKEISELAYKVIGWNKNTTYTIIKKLVEKNAIERIEPNFRCKALIEKSLIQKIETENLINKLYNGSKKSFFAAFLGTEKLSEKQKEELLEMIRNA